MRFKLIITAMACLLVGFAGGYFYAIPSTDKVISRLEASGVLRPILIEEFSVNGDIQSIGSNELTIKSRVVPLRDIILGKSIFYDVKITDETEIIKLVAKSAEEFAAEIEEFRNSRASSDSTEDVLSPPSFNEELPALFSELNVGNNILIISDEEIANKKSITATKIILSESVE